MNEQSTPLQTENTPQPQSPPTHSFLHKMLFFFFVVLFLTALVYLVYHNGKSIYVNGI